MERQRKSVRWRRKTAGVSLWPHSHWTKHRPAPDSDNRRCQPLTPSFSPCFSHSPYSYLLAALILSVTIWLCLAEWVMLEEIQSLLWRKTSSAECWASLNVSHARLLQLPRTHTQTHLAFTWLLGDWTASARRINGCKSGVNAPVSHWIIWTSILRCTGMLSVTQQAAINRSDIHIQRLFSQYKFS